MYIQFRLEIWYVDICSLGGFELHLEPNWQGVAL